MPGSSRRPGRSRSLPNPQGLRRLLQSRPYPSRSREGRPSRPSCPDDRVSRGHPVPRRPPSPIRPDKLNGTDRDLALLRFQSLLEDLTERDIAQSGPSTFSAAKANSVFSSTPISPVRTVRPRMRNISYSAARRTPGSASAPCRAGNDDTSAGAARRRRSPK
jgi:hypothetical protein